MLVLAVADYALWDWSIAVGHDIVSLVAGLTLLPLVAVSLGGLALAAVRLLGMLLARAAPSPTRVTHASQQAEPPERTRSASASRSDSSSGRLAA